MVELEIADNGHVDGDGAPYWESSFGTFVAFPDGVEMETEDGELVAPEILRLEAIKMLAAAVACEQHRAQRGVDNG